MKRFAKFQIAFVVLQLMVIATSLASSGYGQQADPSQSEACQALPALNDDFVLIDQLKSKSQKEVAELETKIKDYRDTKIPQIERSERELKSVDDEMETLAAKTNLNEDEARRLEGLRTNKKSIETLLDGKTSQNYKDELQNLENDFSWKTEQLRCINAALANMLSPQQRFKFWMSFFFAGLILIVISGFFVIAYKDENVRRAIFGGQTGLQFLTLFSIVIAIILFGITNILEGRELAALLGGLSGYILGKYSMSDIGTQTNGQGPRRRSVAQITLDPDKVDLSPTNLTQQITATATDPEKRPISIEDLVLQWTSGDPSVANVDSSGLISRVAPGNCIVFAIANGLRSNDVDVTSS